MIMLEKICSDLLGMGERVWARYAHAREPLRGKVPFETYYNDYYVPAAAEGRSLAEMYQGKTPAALVEELGLRLIRTELAPGTKSWEFASFTAPDEIRICATNARESQMILDSLEDPRLRSVNIESMLTAHEVFHALQQKHSDLFIDRQHILLWKILGVENRSRLVSLEEVAAMSFAKNLLGLQIDPYACDVIMCMPANPDKAKEIYRILLAFQEEEKRGNSD